MKRILYILAVVALAGLAVWQIVKIAQTHNKVPAQEQMPALSGQDIEGIVHDELSEAYNGIPLNIGAISLNDFRGDTLSLAEVLGDNSGGTLVARYSASGCRPCIEKTMEMLMEHGVENPSDSIIVLIAGCPPRDLNVFAAQYGRRFRFYGADSFPLDFDGGISPVVFRLGPDGIVSDHEVVKTD